MKTKYFRFILIAFTWLISKQLCLSQDEVLLSATPESFPGANDGKIQVSIGNSTNFPPPYIYRLNEQDKDPIEIQSNEDVAIFTGLGYGYYCLTVIMADGCFANGCFDFEAPCVSDDCLIADFDFAYTSDGCTIQFYDWSKGDATSWEWDFGDGSSSTSQNPTHIYSESRCYNVTLEVTRNGLTREISKEVCITACSDESAPAPECQINAVTFAAADQTINLNVSGVGVGPFDYNWTTSGFIDPMPNNISQVISAHIPSNSSNGDQYNFSVALVDNNNQSVTCYHTITVGGNPPDVEVAAFGSFEAFEPLVLVAFVDFFNLTGHEEYYFYLKKGSQVIDLPGSCLNTWLNGDWDCTLPSGIPDGNYTLCVQVRDDAGIYEHCISITIGAPTSPPTSADMYIEIKSPLDPKKDPTTQHYILESGDHFEIGINGSHPGASHPYPCVQEEYYVVFYMENLTTGVTYPPLGDPADGDPIYMCSLEGSTYDEDTGTRKGKGLNWAYQIGEGCGSGTLKITADVYNIRCDEFAFPPDLSHPRENDLYPITEPIYIDLYPKKPTISEISIDNNACDFPINVTLFSSCAIASYEWHVYDPTSNEEIEGFFAGNTNAAIVYPDLNHDMYYNYQSGAVVRVRCKVTVVDVNGFTSEYSSLLMMRVPLRIDLPSTIYRCPGAESYFSESSIAAGGISGYEYEWSVVQPVGGALNFASNDPHDPNPLFTAPTSGSIQYKVAVKNVNEFGEVVCQIEKTVNVVVSNINLDLPDIPWPICSPTGRAVGPGEPENLGGSGHYSFAWSPATYLSDANVSNPVISGVSVGETVPYTLTVTDLYGGCTSSDNISVTGVANTHTASFPVSPVSICYGTEAVLEPTVSPIETAQPWGNAFNEFVWSTNNPHHDLSGVGSAWELPIDEIVSSHPGPYVYTVRYQNIITGCFADASVNVTIQKPLKYQGYNPAIKNVVQGTSVPFPLWEGGDTDLNFILSGIGNQGATVEWFPFDPTNKVPGSFGIPKNGRFVPTPDVPYLTMKVTDNATGCQKTFKSMRYIISQAQPELWMAADNTYFCVNGWICFDIVLDVHLANYQTSLLPDKLTLSIALNAPANSPQQPDHLYSTVDLKLDNSSGLYKGQFCEGSFFQSPTSYAPYSIDASTTGLSYEILGHLNSDLEIEISGPVPAPASITRCLPSFSGGLEKAVKFDFGLQCSTNGLVSSDGGGDAITTASDYIEFHPDWDIEVVPSTSPGNNMGRLFVINPCIVPQLLGEDPETSQLQPGVIVERIDSALSAVIDAAALHVFPNPFGDEINISFQIPADCVGKTTITLFDVTGKTVEILQQMENCPLGKYQFVYNAGKLPPGLYFYELKTCNNQRIVQKAVKIGF